MNIKQAWKKIWHFIWEDNSIWSWLVNIILAFLLIKFIVYPGLGFALSTSHPIVAVVSTSMEHRTDFDAWWKNQEDFYSNYNITESNFLKYKFKNGFNMGDIIVLRGAKPEDIKIGDVIVFQSQRPDPIIHRVIKKWGENGNYFFQTKGDNNPSSIKVAGLDETRVSEQQVIGRAWFKVPWLGWVKIIFVKGILFIGNLFR